MIDHQIIGLQFNNQMGTCGRAAHAVAANQIGMPGLAGWRELVE
jgi:hypothetical protein